jgi:RecB family exonuclease
VRRAAEELRARPPEDVEKTFEVPVGDVVLRGRIDRIDRYPEGDLIRDYKTGQHVRGTDVQLDAYLLAVERPAGAVYEMLASGRREGFALAAIAVPGVEAVTAAEIAGRREAMRRIVAEVAAAARAGRLAVHPRDPEDCTRGKCDGYDLCRVARGRWLAKAARP